MHLSEDDLERLLQQASHAVKVGGIYVHYKNPEHKYKVLGLIILTETNEVGVLYQGMYGHRHTFVRPLNIWLEPVVLNGMPTSRFTQEKDLSKNE